MRNLAVEFNKLCRLYLQAFCDRHGYDLGEWEEPGGYAEINGDYVAFDVIKYDVDYKVPIGTYERYVNHIADADGFINYPSYISMYGAEIDKYDKEHKLINKVCLALEIDAATLIGKTRKADVVLIRHCLAYHWRKQGICLQIIAELLGRTNHTTVLNSVQKVEDFIAFRDRKTLKILEVINNA